MSEIKSAFKALTPEQQAVITQRRVSGARTADEWLALLTPIAEFDSKADAVRAGAGGFFARRFARKHDLPFGLRLFAVPLLPILREDQAADAQLELALDLTGPEQKGKETGSSEPYRKGAYHKVVDTFYDDTWLEAHTKFADGTDVRFSVTDHVRSSKKTKKSASGKTKRKTKSKKKTELAVALSFPARNYAATTAKTERGGMIKKESIKPGEDRTVVRLTRLVLPARIDGIPEPEILLSVIGEAYGRVDPTRRKKL